MKKADKLNEELNEIESLIKGFIPKDYTLFECPESTTEYTGSTFYIMDNNDNIVDSIPSGDEVKQIIYDKAFQWLQVYNRKYKEYVKMIWNKADRHGITAVLMLLH